MLKSLRRIASRVYRRLRGAAHPSPAEKQNIQIIADSGLFDEEWYLSQNPDVAESGIAALEHFVRFGHAELRSPSPDFDIEFYAPQYPQATAKGMNAFVYHILHGQEQGLSPVSPEHPAGEGSLSLSLVEVPASNSNLRIGVVIHAYYVELLPELLNACAAIPDPVRFYVATSSDEAKAIAEELFARERPEAELTVEVIPNRGRNVSTITTTFGPRILAECDVFCHIHTKKSLHLGRDQVNWRHDILRNLLNDASYVRKLMAMFETDPSLGVIVPVPYIQVPYFSCSVSFNREELERLCSILEVPSITANYFDFPVGCMFWARTQALKQLLDGRIGYEDYPAEARQIDGTLAHAIERVIIHLAQSNGFNFIEVNARFQTFLKNFGSRNFYQYVQRCTEPKLIEEIDSVNLVSFGFMGTLVTGKDWTTREVSLEELVPRERVVSVLARAKGLGKRVILVADTIWHREQILAAIQSEAALGIDQFYLSGELGMFQDYSSLWKHVLDSESVAPIELLHVGSDERMDVHVPGKMGIRHFHLLSPQSLFENRTRRHPEPPPEGVGLIYNDPFEGRRP